MAGLNQFFPLMNNNTSSTAPKSGGNEARNMDESLDESSPTFYPGVPLTGASPVYEVSSNTSTDDDELAVTPITLYKTEKGSEYGGGLITVNENYIVYPIRNGLIRVINQTSVNRVLLRSHEAAKVLELAFFSPAADLLLSAGTNGRIVLWKLIEHDTEITYDVVGTIPVNAQRVIWHPNQSHLLAWISSDEVYLSNANTINEGMDEEQVKAVSLFCKHSRSSQVRDLAFSPDGHALVTSCGSEISVFDLKSSVGHEATILRTFKPTGEHNIGSLLFCGLDHILIGNTRNDSVSVWKNVVSSSSAELKQTLCLSSSSENAPEEYTMQLDASRRYLYIAAKASPKLYVVHITEGAKKMNNIREFTLAHPILSMTIANRKPVDRGGAMSLMSESLEMQLFCIQTMAIQQYHVFSNQCYVATAAAEEEEATTTTTVTSPVQPSPPRETAGGGFVPAFGVPTDDEVNGKMQTVGAITTEDANNNTTSDGGQGTEVTETSAAVAASAAIGVPAMEACMQNIVRQEIQSVLIPAIGRIVLHTTERNLLHPLQQSMKSVITSSGVVDSIGAAVAKDVPQKLEAELNPLVEKIADEVRVPVKEAFRDCFQEIIIPSFQAATQKMLKQINQTVTKSISASVENQFVGDKLDKVQVQVDSLTKSVEALTLLVQNQAEMAAASSSSSLDNSGFEESNDDGSIAFEVKLLLQNQEYEEAFQKVLSAQNVDLVLEACKSVPSSTVLNPAQPLLSPMIVLCLVQQIGSNLATSDTGFKLDYLRDALLALNKSDASISGMVPSVLHELQNNMSMIMPEHRDSRFAIVQHILKSMLSV